MERLTFSTLAVPGKTAQSVLMMANSLRTFGGKLSDSPVWALVPAGMNEFSKPIQQAFTSLKVEIIPYPFDAETQKFPFSAKVNAAAHAETLARHCTELLCWLDRDNIILREPNEFLLSEGKNLGYRPVHHKLIGPAWDEPLDSFWELIYRTVPPDRQIPMSTHTGEKIRPYINAGTFVIRPKRDLLVKWRNVFNRQYHQPEFQVLYETDERYAIFMHQAVFTEVLLQNLEPIEMQELSPKINYPLHLHADIPAAFRPVTINILITLRYENTFCNPTWQESLPIEEPLRSWLKAQPLIQNALSG
jgi:hypothetical protein